MPHTILDFRTWEEFEEKLKELQEKAPDEHRPDSLPFLYRGQENSCWTINTTLERPLDGRVSIPFGDYYLSIYRAKPEIESYTEKSWDVPDPPEVKSLTERVEPFTSFTKEAFKTWGQVWSYMVHLRHDGFPSPFLDWTRSPYVATFFAFRRPIKGVEKVSIYAYCETLNARDHPKGFSSGRPEIHILPKQYFPTHRRHFLQQSEYTICVQNRESEWLYVPHEEVFSRSDLNHDVLWKFSLPATERLKVLKLLDRSNINAFALFQSEESLMETMAFRELDCHRLTTVRLSLLGLMITSFLSKT